MIRKAALLLPAALVLLASPQALRAGTIRKAVDGELLTVDGVRVLKVRGTPFERGRAHGILLGREMMDIVNAFLTGPRAKAYREKLMPVLPLAFRWPPHIEAELKGLFEGVEETLPEADRRISALDRTLRLDDVKAFNTLGDWAALACSSLSAWGASTEGGRTLAGRNFDYVLPGGAHKMQILLAEPAADGRKAFVTVTFPGSIGAITFLNEEGVFGAVHDVHVKPEGTPLGNTPRLTTLRLIAESASPTSAIETALALCRKHRSLYGNNFHIAAPNLPGVERTAAVIEYDADTETDGGATLRLPAGGGLPRIWNTNHYRSRAPPKKCGRFASIDEAFQKATAEGAVLDVAGMKAVIGAGSASITMHEVVVELKARRIHIALQQRMFTSAAKATFHLVRWEDLFGEAEKEDGEEAF